MENKEISQRSGAIWIAAVGLVLLTAYAVAGTLQTLVWNPLAAVPGATLEEIHTGFDQANETLRAPLVIAWAVIAIVVGSRPVSRAGPA